MIGKCRARWDLFQQSADKKMKWNQIDSLPVGTRLYGFKVRVTSVTRCSIVGKEIHELTVLHKGSYKNSAYRTRKDGTSFKKPCHTYDYCMYFTKAEAEAAQQNVALDLQNQVKEELEILMKMQKEIETILT